MKYEEIIERFQTLPSSNIEKEFSIMSDTYHYTYWKSNQEYFSFWSQ